MDVDFFKELDVKPFLNTFFNNAPDLYVFAKDRKFCFTMMNKALLERLGLSREEQVIGKSDDDFFDANVAELFRLEDRELFESKAPLLNRTWSVPNGKGSFDWYISSKYPLHDQSGEVHGYIGVMRGIAQARNMLEPYAQLNAVTSYIQQHYHKQIEVSTLAGLMNLSLSQFERKFKKLVHMTPLKFINKIRIDNACERLIHSHDTLSTIALECGFFDHSYFAKIFKKQMGKTPGQYRQQYYAR